MNDAGQRNETPLWTLLRVLRQRFLLVALCTVLVPAIAYAASASQEDEYTATTKLLFTPSDAQAAFLSDSAGSDPASSSGQQDAETSLDLVSLRAIAQQTSEALGPGFSTGAIEAAVEVAAQDDSSVVDITATAPSAADAAKVANAYSEQYIEFRRTRARGQLDRAVSQIEDKIASASTPEAKADLQDRADELELLADLQTGNAEVVQRARAPGAPSSPMPLRAATLGLGFGLLLGIALALALEMVSRRLNDPKSVELVYESPILGVIPKTSFLQKKKVDAADIPMGERNAFQNVRTNLRYYNDYNIGSALVVSSAPEEGKTTVAWNLALAAAEAGVRTILLEADMRLPSLTRRVSGLSESGGLNAVLNRELDVESAIQRVPLGGSDSNGSSAMTLDVLTAGAPHPSPTRLIESDEMEAVLLDLEERYELVVVDTPPALVVSDAISLIDKVGGVIIVSRVRRDTRDAAAHLKRALDHVGAPILGIVINDVSAQEGLRGYGYGYETSGGGGDRAPQGTSGRAG